jgi:hypothetical protein
MGLSVTHCLPSRGDGVMPRLSAAMHATAGDGDRTTKKPPPGRSSGGFFLARDPRNKPLPPHPNAIDATVHVATGVMTDRSARHRTRP